MIRRRSLAPLGSAVLCAAVLLGAPSVASAAPATASTATGPAPEVRGLACYFTGNRWCVEATPSGTISETKTLA